MEIEVVWGVEIFEVTAVQTILGPWNRTQIARDKFVKTLGISIIGTVELLTRLDYSLGVCVCNLPLDSVVAKGDSKRKGWHRNPEKGKFRPECPTKRFFTALTEENQIGQAR